MALTDLKLRYQGSVLGFLWTLLKPLMQFAVLYAPRAPAVDTGGIPVDKLVHVAVFALPTVALIGAGVPRGWVIGLMSVHAPLSEVVQGALLADRSPEGADVLADLAGVAPAEETNS